MGTVPWTWFRYPVLFFLSFRFRHENPQKDIQHQAKSSGEKNEKDPEHPPDPGRNLGMLTETSANTTQPAVMFRFRQLLQPIEHDDPPFLRDTTVIEKGKGATADTATP